MRETGPFSLTFLIGKLDVADYPDSAAPIFMSVTTTAANGGDHRRGTSPVYLVSDSGVREFAMWSAIPTGHPSTP